MMNEATSNESNARDGLRAGLPVPREPDEPDGTSFRPGEESAEASARDFKGGTANSAGGMAYVENAEGAEPGDAPDVQGLNTAAGPAEEEDAKDDDDRALTTDISPSD